MEKIIKVFSISVIFFISGVQFLETKAAAAGFSETGLMLRNPSSYLASDTNMSSFRLYFPILDSITYSSNALSKNGETTEWKSSADRKLSLIDHSNLLLPDLQTLPPSDLIIQENRLTGQKLLRLTNSVINSGVGALELKGVVDLETGNASITQQIYTIDGSIIEREVNEYIFHPVHDHWHFNNFARYELWSISPDFRLEALISLSDKVSFCLRDIERSDLLEGTERAAFTRCGQESQGISPGWIDTYQYYLDGQTIDITDLPDGLYVLRSIADPGDQLWEVDSTNNDTAILIQIKGLTVEVVENIFEIEAKDKYRRID
ncbi:MAG: hypothetical protein IBX69_15055 [Anaerolineales bacterium]|nr:hypothetical protein [Anaerolineales bacterium]